jgi:hypothetical protein
MTRERFNYTRNGKAVNVERLSPEHKDWLELWELSVCKAYARETGRLFLHCGLRHRLTNGVGVYDWAYWGRAMRAIRGDAANWARWLEQFRQEAEHGAECRSTMLPAWFVARRGNYLPRISGGVRSRGV